MFTFLRLDAQNCVFAKVTSSRMLEYSLAVLKNIIVRTPKKKAFDKFMAEIRKMQDICRHMNSNIKEYSFVPSMIGCAHSRILRYALHHYLGAHLIEGVRLLQIFSRKGCVYLNGV